MSWDGSLAHGMDDGWSIGWMLIVLGMTGSSCEATRHGDSPDRAQRRYADDEIDREGYERR